MTKRILALALFATLALATPAAAADPPFDSCGTYGDLTICTAQQVPSFDGSKLDVDLTLPMRGTGATHPLMIFLHGFGNNKREWESMTDEGDGADKFRWNSHWFARHGFYVLTYTARGFRTDPPQGDQPPTPSGTSVDVPSGTIQIKSREVEVRDTQYLASLVADAFPDVDRDRVAVSGGSYGGGESWLQAADPVWDDFTTPALHLQVAVPKYPWTDLGFSLAPNGRTSAGVATSPTGDGFPFGTPKLSYITALFAVGNAKGVFEAGTRTTPNTEGPIDIPLWNAWIVGKGDPYSPEDAIVKQARRGLTEYRSAFYQDTQWAAQAADPQTAIFSISGWTDDLFEAIESFRMFDYLKALNPLWPVEVAVADVGHSRAQNRPSQWQKLNEQAWQFLQANINGAHEQQTTVSSMPTLCGTPNADATMRLTGSTPQDLSAGTLSVAYTRGDEQTNESGLTDTDGPATDPIVGEAVPPVRPNDSCRQSTRSAEGDAYTAYSTPLPSSRTYIGLGHVVVPYDLVGVTATLHARVWDVAPDGTALLMTRGTYRIDTLAAGDADPPAGTLELPLYGNHWPLAPGHRIRLDLQEADNPTFRPTNAANTLTFSPPKLVLPTREAGDLTLTGG
jgi:predicted acyl esterase